MAFEQGVFTSTSVTVNGDGIPVGDKAVSAAFLAREKYHLARGNGISLLPTSAFYVAPVSGLTARVSAGWGIMEGYSFAETTDYDITMTSSGSEQTLYIGVRLDVATGIFTDSHVAARTTFVAATDRVFAIIVIPASAVTLTTAMITDTRRMPAYCGAIDEYDVTLQEMIESFYANGLPAHSSTHATGGDDAITPSDIGAQPEMTAGVDYADPTTIAQSTNCGIFNGGVVAAQGTPDQTVSVTACNLITPEGKRYAVSAVSSLAATAADATNPRIDIVYVSSAGVVTYLAGTAAASPSQPATPANGTILYSITRAANDNTIASSDLTNQRDFISRASDFEDIVPVTEAFNSFDCYFSGKHTRNFSLSITNATGKVVVFSSVPYGTCDAILTIKATATAAVTWTLDSRALVWPNGAPTLTSGYTYLILFTYSPLLGKWMGFAQAGGAN